ncbi:hypothetical protein Tco_0725475 [Tanacetum coccineum]|uniref:Uncharacterized protein n=1 Tax=Tanacetum coccineum TaxID=301880 RepID=A0ABQ4YD05_9ASTR
MNMEQKRQKDDSGVLHVIDTKKKQTAVINIIAKEMSEVKGQWTGAKQHGQVISLPNAEHTPLCSRTPLAEKIIST